MITLNLLRKPCPDSQTAQKHLSYHKVLKNKTKQKKQQKNTYTLKENNKH